MREIDEQMEDLRAQQASAWVSTLVKKEGSDHPEFVAWLKESPANVREFLLAYSIEQSLNQLDIKRCIDIDSVLAQIDTRVTHLSDAHPAMRTPQTEFTKTPRKWLYLVAAGIAMIGLISWWTLFMQQAGWKEFSTGTGELRALQLEDGSIVHLNARSRIALRFSESARDIKLLEGEALFEVHHDAQRPFQVFTRDAVIRDIGTRFNVYSRSDGMKVAVIEGSVELTALPTKAGTRADSSRGTYHASKPAATHVLQPNEQAQIDLHGEVTVGTTPDIQEATAWWQRRLVYHNEKLAHIVDDFNRYNRRHIQLEGDAIMMRPYTGVFNADDPDSLAQVLANDPGLIVEQLADNTIVVRAR